MTGRFEKLRHAAHGTVMHGTGRKALALAMSCLLASSMSPLGYAPYALAEDAQGPADAIRPATSHVGLSLDGAYIVVGGQTVSRPSTGFDVPAGSDVEFEAHADSGFALAGVSVTDASGTRGLAADGGVYRIPADEVLEGVTVVVSATRTEEEADDATPIDADGEDAPPADAKGNEKQEATAGDAGERPGTYEADGDGVHVSVTLPDPGDVPDGTELRVSRVGEDDPAYAGYISALDDGGGRHDAGNTVIYDVSFVVGGREVEPANGAHVEFELGSALDAIGDAGDVEATHLTVDAGDVRCEDLGDAVSADGTRAEADVPSFSAFSFSTAGKGNAWEGTRVVRPDEAIGGLGVASRYLVFARNLTNTDHIEGNVAADNYYVGGADASFDQLGNIYSRNPLTAVTIDVDGADGTRTFGFYDQSGMLLMTADVTVSGGHGTSTVRIPGTPAEAPARSGPIVVYEMRDGRPVPHGDVVYGGVPFGGSNQASGTDLSNYLGNVWITDGNVNDSASLSDVRSHVLASGRIESDRSNPFVGTTYLGVPFDGAFGGANGDKLVIHANNGDLLYRREDYAASPADYIRDAGTTSYVSDNMGGIDDLSVLLTQASTGEDAAMYVANVSGMDGEQQVWWPRRGTTHALSSALVAAGYADANSGGGIFPGLRDGGYAVINIDCTGLDSFDIDNIIVAGTQTNGQYGCPANRVFFNPVERSGDSFVPYDGLINLTGNFSGILVAPEATVKQGGVMSGEVVADTYIRSGSEMHKETPGSHTARIHVTDGEAPKGHDVEIALTAVKNLSTGDVPEDGAYEFQLIEDGKVIDTVSNRGHGVAFSPIRYTEPGEHTYTIHESSEAEAGWTNAADVDVHVSVAKAADGTLSVTYDGGGDYSAPVMTNTYERPSETSVSLHATKALTGRALRSGEFSFSVYPATDGPLGIRRSGEAVRHASNDGMGEVEFDGFRYTEPGTYAYVIREDAGNDPAIDYDGTEHTAVVTVTRDAGNGLHATVSYDGGGMMSSAPVFENGYAAHGKVTFSGTKTMTGRDLGDGDDYTYSVTEDGEKVASGRSGGDGVISFDDIEYTQEDVGTHTYKITEDDTDVPGVTKDTRTVTVTVAVSDNGDGTLAIEKSGNSDDVDFVNAYDAGETSASLVAHKSMSGRDAKDGEFSFSVYPAVITDDGIEQASGTAVRTATNDADGNVSFAPIPYDREGVYAYVIREDAGDAGGVTYDGTIRTATVTVKDDDGRLVASVDYGGGEPVFENSYMAHGKARVVAQKSLTGRMLAAGAFGFTLTGVSDNARGTVLHARNDADGRIAFDEIGYDEPGTYVYRLTEDLPEAAVGGVYDGVTYDTVAHEVRVTMTDDGNGTLVPEIAYDGGRSLTIENSAFDARATIALTKEWYGEDMGRAFAFRLTAADVDWNERTGASVEYDGGDVTDDGESAFAVIMRNGAFEGNAATASSEITYHKAGMYRYLLTEDGADGVTCDPAVYEVTVTVNDDASTDVAYRLRGGGDGDAVFYNNGTMRLSFSALGHGKDDAVGHEVSVTPTVKKTLDGADLDAGEFEFALDGKGVHARATNASDGTVAFPRIRYTEPGEYDYAATEIAGGDETVEYDGATIGVHVSVTESEDGTLSADVTYTRDGRRTDEPAFVNRARGIDLRVRKTSKEDGEPLEGARYGLWMHRDGGRDVYMGNATSDANGYMTFPDADVREGESYYFKEEDAPDGHLVTPYRDPMFTVTRKDGRIVVAYEGSEEFDSLTGKES